MRHFRVLVFVAILAVAATAIQMESVAPDATAQSVSLSVSAEPSCTTGRTVVKVVHQTGGATPNYHEIRMKRATASWPALGGWNSTIYNFTERTYTTSSDGVAWDIQVRQVYQQGPTFSYGQTASTQGTGARVGCPSSLQSLEGSSGSALTGTVLTTWLEPEDGTTPTRYQYRYKVTTATWPTTGSLGWTSLAAGVKQFETPTAIGLQWDVQVRSVDSVGSPSVTVYSIPVQDTRSGCCSRSILPTPTSFSATAGTTPGQVTLSWSPAAAPTDLLWRDTSSRRWRLAAGVAPSDGRIRRTASGTTHTLTLIPNHSYEFAIQNSSSSGGSGLRTASARTRGVPAPVSLSLTASTTNLGQINAQWNYPSPAGITLGGFEYQARAAGGSWPSAWTDATAPATNPNAPGTTWTASITGVGTLGGSVDVRVRSEIDVTPAGGSSTTYRSSAVSGSQQLPAPSPPTSVAATAGTNAGDLAVSWTAPTASLAGSAVYNGYRIRRKLSTASQYGSWSTVAAGTTSTTISTGVGNLQYDVQVQTIVDLDGDTTGTTTDVAYSTSASGSGTARAIAAPTAPGTGVAAQTNIDGEARLSWVAPTGVTVARYRYRYAVVPAAGQSPSWSSWLQTSEGTATSATVTGLTVDGNYQFEIEAVHATQGTSAALTASLQLQILPNSVPSAPSNFSAAATEVYGQFRISWEAPPTGTATKYQLRYKRSTDSYPATGVLGWADVTPTTSSGTHTYLLQTTGDGIAWDIGVRAVDTTTATPGLGSPATANPPVEPKQVPPPEWFSAETGTVVGSIETQWGDPTVSGFSPTRFEFRRKIATGAWTDPGSAWTVVPGGSSRRTRSISSLTSGTNYDVQVRAVLDVTSSVRVYSGVLADQAVASSVVAITGFTARLGTSPGAVVLRWNDPVGTVQSRAVRIRSAPTDQWGPEIALAGASPQTVILAPGESILLGISAVTSTGRTGISSISRTVTPPSVRVPRNLSATASTTDYGAADLTFQIPSGSNQFDGFEYRSKRTNAPWESTGDEGWADTPAPTNGMVTQTVTDPDAASGITVDVQVRTKVEIQLLGANSPATHYSTALSTTAELAAVPDPTRVSARPGLLVGDLNVRWTNAAVTLTGYTRVGTRIQYRKLGDDEWQIEDKTGGGLDGLSARSHFFNFEVGWEGYDIIVQTIAESTGGTRFYSRGVMRFARTKATEPPLAAGDGISAERTAVTGQALLKWQAPTDVGVDKYRIRYSLVPDDGEPMWEESWRDLPATPTRATVSGLALGRSSLVYSFQIQAFSNAFGGSEPLEVSLRFPALTVAHDFAVFMSPGTATLSWREPPPGTADGYRYRWRKTEAPDVPASWNAWIYQSLINEDPENERERQEYRVHGLASRTSYTFELQSVYNENTFGRSVYRDASTLIALPSLSKAEPQVRTVTISAGQQVRLSVDVYGIQGHLANTEADNSTGFMAGVEATYRWNDSGAGGRFVEPDDERQALYVAPREPGTYRIVGEVGPVGICGGHHEVPPDFEACRAIITLVATRPTGNVVPDSDPVNPVGLIPSSVTDGDGNAYAVFTPVEGGRFIDDASGATITASPGDVPDGTMVGIRAETVAATDSASGFAGARFTFADSRIRVVAADARGEVLTGYRFDDAVQLCTPLPAQFRERLDAVQMIQLAASTDDDLTVLTSKVYKVDDGLRICGAVSQLPATVAVARIGVDPVEHDGELIIWDTPDAGGAAPTPMWLAATGLTAALLLMSVAGVSVLGARRRSVRG